MHTVLISQRQSATLTPSTLSSTTQTTSTSAQEDSPAQHASKSQYRGWIRSAALNTRIRQRPGALSQEASPSLSPGNLASEMPLTEEAQRFRDQQIVQNELTEYLAISKAQYDSSHDIIEFWKVSDYMHFSS
jgi:hypothetical protein